MMKLHIAPGACSLAAHIAAIEAAIPLDIATAGFDAHYREHVNPKGLVPALQIDAANVLTETPVVLQYLADLRPEAGLLPPPASLARWRALEWLAYIASELHKGYGNPKHSDESQPRIQRRLRERFDHVEQALRGQPRGWLGPQFSVADLYLFAVCRWIPLIGLARDAWPALDAHFARVAARPATVRALADEGITA